MRSRRTRSGDLQAETLLDDLTALVQALADSTSLPTDTAGDFADKAVNLRETETLMAIKGILGQKEAQVRKALERARAGTYGLCEDCGQPISKERREVCPEATRCLECQAKHERIEGRYQPSYAMQFG